MAQKVSIELVDDLDGKPAEQTVHFGLDGTNYEIDLSQQNIDKLNSALAPFLAAARKVGKSGTKRRTSTGKSNAAEVRAWAKDQGLDVPDRGRIPASITKQFEAAN